MKQKLLDSIKARLEEEVSKKNPVYILNSHPLSEALDAAIVGLYMYTRTKKDSSKAILMTEVVCGIGHSACDNWKLPKNSALAAKIGAFLLYSFEANGIIKVKIGAGNGKHQTYLIDVLDDAAITQLWETITLEHITKLPSLHAYANWTTTRHESGASLVKTANKEVLSKLTPENTPLVYEAINRAQQIGWNVNQEVYNVYTWALRNKTDAFSDIWEMQNPEAKASKIREAVTVGSIAKRLLHETFYHGYTYDFRGRRYCSSAFFHEQGTDLSKGLLLYAKRKPMTKQGFYWLLISIASNWAGASDRVDKVKTDKIPLRDRVYWSLDHEATLVSYAADPRKNQGWMRAEKPWQFLAACVELKNLRAHQRLTGEEYDYASGLVVYVDG